MTSYAGVDFPHIRLARWAVLFEALQLHWRFRPDIFAVDGNVAAIPDFELQLSSGELVWVLVKPKPDADSLLAALSESTGRKGLVVANPAMREMALVYAGELWLPPLPLSTLLPRLTGCGTLDCTAACNRALIERFGVPSYRPQRVSTARHREQAQRLLDDAGRSDSW